MDGGDKSIAEIYPWLKCEFFENFFRNRLKNPNLKITDIETSKAIPTGENYSSLILRVVINFNKHDPLNAILKVEHQQQDVADTVNQFNVFEKEVAIYSTILPEVHNLLDMAGIPVRISPDFITSGVKPNYMMMEDLSIRRFRNADKQVGLDYKHLKMTLEKLAYYHAATAVLGTNEPDSMNLFLTGMVSRDVDVFHPVLVNTLRESGSVIRQWNGFEEAGEKLEQLAGTFIDRCIETFESDSNGFHVLNHGDLWSNNIMYKYDECGEIQDTLFVDLSVGWWGSPAIDIAYLLFSSCACGVNEEDWDYLLKYYHDVLTTTLIKLNYAKKLPKLVDIQHDFLSKSKYPLVISLILHNVRQIVNREQSTTDNIVGQSEEATNFRLESYNSRGFRKYVTPLLNYWLRKGLLE